MEVRFVKGKQGRTCSWTAVRDKRRRVPGTTMAAGGDVPHDLAGFVIERALGIEHGFWGCIADGATFRSLDRRRTEPGVAVIRRHREDLDAAEQRVNDLFFAWRRGEPTPVSDVLDDALVAWRSLAEGEALVLEWLATSRRLVSGRSGRSV